jgi:serine protease Do
VTPPIAAQLGLQRTDGVAVQQLVPSGPAALAGVQQGDVITAIGGVAVKGQRDLQLALTNRFKPGQAVDVTLDRSGASQTVKVTLGTKPGL